MKTTLFTSFAAAMMLLGTVSQAASSVGPVTPVLQCKNAMEGLPESKLSVQVSRNGANEESLSFVTVQNIDLNKGTSVLFSGSVNQETDGDSTILMGNGMNMRVIKDESGIVKGSIAINNGQSLKYFNVDCTVLYQIEPQQPATM